MDHTARCSGRELHQWLTWMRLPRTRYYAAADVVHIDRSCARLHADGFTGEDDPTLTALRRTSTLHVCDCAYTFEDGRVMAATTPALTLKATVEENLPVTTTTLPSREHGPFVREAAKLVLLRWELDEALNPWRRSQASRAQEWLTDEHASVFNDRIRPWQNATADAVRRYRDHAEPRNDLVYALLDPVWLFCGRGGPVVVKPARLDLALRVQPLAGHRSGRLTSSAVIGVVASETLLRQAEALGHSDNQILDEVRPGDDPAAILQVVCAALDAALDAPEEPDPARLLVGARNATTGP